MSACFCLFGWIFCPSLPVPLSRSQRAGRLVAVCQSVYPSGEACGAGRAPNPSRLGWLVGERATPVCAVTCAGYSVQALTSGEGALGSLAKFADSFERPAKVIVDAVTP
jgi:hypothetical protein